MGGENTEVQIARLDERLQQILREMELSRDGRKQQYEKLEQLNQSVTVLSGRVENVENSLAKTAPTIDEFLVIKHKVVGAGIMGKWLWAAGGGLISLAFASRETILGWLSK
ncbi:hypothetical protein D3C87_1866310 [compost metagenome]